MTQLKEHDGVPTGAIIDELQERVYFLEQALTAIGYDAKASKKRRFIHKKQEETLRGITRAFCVETIDPWKENRVRFFHLFHIFRTY